MSRPPQTILCGCTSSSWQILILYLHPAGASRPSQTIIYSTSHLLFLLLFRCCFVEKESYNLCFCGSSSSCKPLGGDFFLQVQASCEQAMRLWWEDFHPGWMIFTLGNQHFETLNQIIQYSQSSIIKGGLAPMQVSNFTRVAGEWCLLLLELRN